MDEKGNALSWQSTPKNFLFHHDTLSRVYKAKLADELRAAELYELVPAAAWKQEFVVDIEAVGHGVPTLKYLAPYVHRVAINNSRIVSVDEQSVTYKIRRSKTNRVEIKRVDGEVFVESFLQHVLPRGFQKIRHYGWMSANSKVSLDEVKWLVWLFLGWTYWLASGYAPQAKPLTTPLRCKACGGVLRVVEVTFESLQSRGIVPDQSLGYFDSG